MREPQGARKYVGRGGWEGGGILLQKGGDASLRGGVEGTGVHGAAAGRSGHNTGSVLYLRSRGRHPGSRCGRCRAAPVMGESQGCQCLSIGCRGGPRGGAKVGSGPRVTRGASSCFSVSVVSRRPTGVVGWVVPFRRFVGDH